MTHPSRPIVFVLGLLIGLSLACASLGSSAPRPTVTPAAATSTPATASGGAPTSGPTEAETPTPTQPPAPTSTEVVTPTPTNTEDVGATATAVQSQTGLGLKGPSDVPVMSGSIQVLTATDMQVVYQTTADKATLVKFYTDQMPLNGWTLGATTSLTLPPTTSIIFTKGHREADVSIIDPPGAKQRLVTIVITSH